MYRFIRDKEIEKKIIDYLADKGVKKIEIFGSYVRGEDYNDIDFIKYQLDLEDITGKKIDLIAGEEAISNYILPYIEKERKTAYESKYRYR